MSFPALAIYHLQDWLVAGTEKTWPAEEAYRFAASCLCKSPKEPATVADCALTALAARLRDDLRVSEVGVHRTVEYVRKHERFHNKFVRALTHYYAELSDTECRVAGEVVIVAKNRFLKYSSVESRAIDLVTTAIISYDKKPRYWTVIDLVPETIQLVADLSAS